ncbi:MAG: FlgD immunoglobulin-like domain containing protein [Candidatus Eiseniibacteriota bacterium]
MSRSSLAAACVLALILILIRAESTRSSYMWEPAVQVSNTPYRCVPNVDPSWSKTGSRRIHHVFKECVNAAGDCDGDSGMGLYLEVGPGLDASAWNSAWSARDTLNSNGMGASDFDMVVDRNDVVHVVHEVFHHPAYGVGQIPVIAYKMKGRRSWDPDTAVVLEDTLTAGTIECTRRGHGPKLFLEPGGDEDTIHVAIPYDNTDTVNCARPTPPMHHAMIYLKKDVAPTTPDTGGAWPNETFATQEYAKHNKVTINGGGGIQMLGAGIFSLLRDSTGTLHMWGIQKLEATTGADTLLWRHFWGTPGEPETAWQDTTSRVLLKDDPPLGFAESGGEPAPLNNAVATDSSLYFLWKRRQGPGIIHRVPVGGPYPDTTGLNSSNTRQLTASGVAVEHLKLRRAADGVWHLTWRARPDPSAEPQIWHKYVTTEEDPFDATSEVPDTPGGWSTPSMVAADFGSGIRDGKQAWYVANGDTVWITFAAEAAGADTTDEVWFRKGYPIGSDSVLAGKQVWDGLVSLDADFYVAPNCTLEIKPGTMVVAADSTDRLAGGVDPNLVELIVQGTLLADGTAAEPIEFRSADTTATNGWYGIRLDLIGSTWTGYGYIGSEEPLSSIAHATIRDAAKGISIENLIAPNLADVQFTNIGGSPAKHIYLDSTDVVLPYGVWDRTANPDTVKRVPGTWDLARVNVIAANAASQDAPYGAASQVDLIVQGKLFTSGSSANGDSTYFRPESPTSAGNNWGGLLLDFDAAGSVIEYLDIGYAANPVFLFYADSSTALRHCRIHDFADVGIWVDEAVGFGGIIESNTVERGTNVLLSLGRTGILLDGADQMVVKDNKVDLSGLVLTGGTSAAIDVMWGSSWCNANPPGGERLVVQGNWVVGPGTGALLGTHSGIRSTWICAQTNRRVDYVRNYVEDFNLAGLALTQTQHIQADSNNVVQSLRAVDISRDSNAALTGPVANWRANWFEYDTRAAIELIRTNNKLRTKFGPSSTLLGDNGFLVADSMAVFMRENDTAVDTLKAEENYWYLDANGSEVFLNTLQEWSFKIRPRLDPDSTEYDVWPVKTSDSPATYFRMSSPPSVGRVMASALGLYKEAGEPSEAGSAPLSTFLSPPLENPIRTATEVVLGVASENQGLYKVEVFDVAGRRVATLLRETLHAGTYRIPWNGTNSSGERVTAGTYFMRAEGPGFLKTQKVTLVR